MTTMKTMIIGAAAALIATVSLASTAEAGWKWKKHHHWGHNHHWGHKHHHGMYIYGHRSYCFIKKVKHYDDWGNVYIKRIQVCPW